MSGVSAGVTRFTDSFRKPGKSSTLPIPIIMPNPSLRHSLAVVFCLGIAAGLLAQAPATPPPAPPPAPPRLAVPAASPAATLKQRVGLTDIEIVYSRPGLKGRVMIGQVEPYGKVWRTGANSATTIAFSTAVKLNGHDIPAGKYALFTIPAEKDWTVILSKNPNQSGAFNYTEAEDLVRFPVTPVPLGESVETFEISLNDIRDDSATINLAWARLRVPIKLELDIVGPTLAKIADLMAAGGPKPYQQAAGFYLDHGQDLNQALAWAEAAVAAGANQTNVHLKAKILAKLGRKADAIAAARQSIELAARSSNAGLRAEYTKMNENLIASLK